MASRSWEFHASTQCCANCRASVSVSIRWIKRIVDVDLKWAAFLRAAQPCCLRAATNAFNARVTIAPMVSHCFSRNPAAVPPCKEQSRASGELGSERARGGRSDDWKKRNRCIYCGQTRGLTAVTGQQAICCRVDSIDVPAITFLDVMMRANESLQTV
jgi:hypothetical protein